MESTWQTMKLYPIHKTQYNTTTLPLEHLTFTTILVLCCDVTVPTNRFQTKLETAGTANEKEEIRCTWERETSTTLH